MLERVEYARAIAIKYPEQIVIVIARDARGVDNPMSVGWTMIASSNPPILAVAINRRAYTVEAIHHSRAFVVAMPSATMAEEVRFYGSRSGRDVHKLEALPTPTAPAAEVPGVLLTDSVACFECTLETEIAVGDHITFFGRVVAAHANTDPSARRLYSLGGGALGGVSGDRE